MFSSITLKSLSTVFLYCIICVKALKVSKPELSSQNRVIVQLTRPASANTFAQRREGVSSQELHDNAIQQQQDFASSLQQSGLSSIVVNTYSNLFNGVSLNLSSKEDTEKLKALPGVLEVFPVRQFKVEPIVSLSSEGSFNFPAGKFQQTEHVMTNLDQLRRDHPTLRGDGIKVGVIDSGIDYTHPAFTLPGHTCTKLNGTGCRVKYGRDFVGDKFDSSSPLNNIAMPDDDPADCSNHGTHVAGIIGGNDDRIQGVAPGVEFGSYRVLGCDGTTDDEIILAALEEAFRDGMDIINISIGGGRYDNSYPQAQAINRLSDNGVIVVMAAGNDGELGYNQVCSPSVASKGFSVASYDNSQSFEKYMTVTYPDQVIDIQFRYSSSEGITAIFSEDQSLNIILSPQNTSPTGDACDPFIQKPFADGVALIQRGGCNFTTKVVNAIDGGAKGVIIYNHIPGGDRMSVQLDSATANFPVAIIDNYTGTELVDNLTTSPSPVFVKFVNSERLFPVDTAGQPSGFSSWGLDMSLLMKPDVSAPGGKIVSSVPVLNGSYKQYSGTSMAAPYLAGVIAIDIQNRGRSPFASLQRRIHVSSKVTMPKDSTVAESVAKIGAGLIDIPKFLFSTTDIEPSKLEFGDGNHTRTRVIKVTNNGSRELRYTVQHQKSKSVRALLNVLTQEMDTEEVFADVTFSRDTFSVPPNQSVDIEVTINPNGASPYYIRSGFIKIVDDSNPDDGGLSIPYALMTGEYSRMPLWSIDSMPALHTAQRETDAEAPAFNGASIPTFDMATKESTPALLLGLIFPVRRLEIILFSKDTNSPLGYIDASSFAQPHGELNLYIIENIVYDIQDTYTKVPITNGKYTIQIKAVLPRALTPVPDIRNALVQIYESPEFVIDRSARSSRTQTTTTRTTSSTPTPTYLL